MFSIRKPKPETIRRFFSAQADLDFTYAAVGATAGKPPDGYVVSHTRIKLGEGEAVYNAAKAAFGRWEQFRLGWVEAWSPQTWPQAGAVVAVVIRTFGLWSLNACRIVYVVNETGPINRFGFAYGTLPAHLESGEERFLIEWDRSNDTVWYDILSFSRPRHFLARLGYPISRHFQKKFARDSGDAMLRAANSPQRFAGSRSMTNELSD